MEPAAAGISPSSAFIIVVLPVPFVPTIAVTDPEGMAKVPCCQMMRPPRDTAASRKTMQSAAVPLFKSVICFRPCRSAAFAAMYAKDYGK